MHPGTLTNRASGAILSRQAFRAVGWFDRLRGWIGQPRDGSVAIGIENCDQVHTFLVGFPLDLVYCDRNGRVLRTVSVAARRVGPRVPGAWVVWEAVAGACLSSGVAAGDVLVWSSADASPRAGGGDGGSEE